MKQKCKKQEANTKEQMNKQCKQTNILENKLKQPIYRKQIQNKPITHTSKDK